MDAQANTNAHVPFPAFYGHKVGKHLKPHSNGAMWHLSPQRIVYVGEYGPGAAYMWGYIYIPYNTPSLIDN